MRELGRDLRLNLEFGQTLLVPAVLLLQLLHGYVAGHDAVAHPPDAADAAFARTLVEFLVSLLGASRHAVSSRSIRRASGRLPASFVRQAAGLPCILPRGARPARKR